jgi:hypothetical protein
MLATETNLLSSLSSSFLSSSPPFRKVKLPYARLSPSDNFIHLRNVGLPLASSMVIWDEEMGRKQGLETFSAALAVAVVAVAIAGTGVGAGAGAGAGVL